MASNNKYFYISGFISLTLFSTFILIILFMMLSSSKVDIYALKKDNYISISLDMPKKITASKKSEQVPIIEESVEELKEVQINDLFNDVWTKSIKPTKKKPKKKVDNKRLQEIAKKTKKINKKNINKIEKNNNNNLVKQKSDESTKASTATEVNEYLAKIQAIVYDNFRPPLNSEGAVVLAIIEISAIGKMIDFRILNYSSNQDMNNECDKIKTRLMGVLFPVNIENKTYKQKIKIISKE